MIFSFHKPELHALSATKRSYLALIHGLVATTFLAACSLTPKGFDEELKASDVAGVSYDVEIEKRNLPALPAQPTLKDVLHRAFLANGDLESAYFQWREALANVRVESAYPNTNLMLGYSYLFSSENMKAFDRSSFDLGFDPMLNLSFPSKVVKAGEVALEEARAKGKGLTAKKFALQEEILSNWAEYEGLSQKLKLAEEKASLLELSNRSILAEIVGGQSQKDFLTVKLEAGQTRNEVETLKTKLFSVRAMLNGRMALDPSTPLSTPQQVETRPISIDDLTLLKASVANNPELLSLVHEVEGKRYSLELARQQWIPDFNPTAMFTGSIEQSLGVSVVLPTAVAKIRAEVDRAEATFNSNLAALRQATLEKGANFVATLFLVRDLERQINLYNSTLLPIAQQLADSVASSYSTGAVKITDLVEAHLNLLEVKDALVEVQVEKAKSLAKLEALMGIDIETFNKATNPQLGAAL